MKMANKSLLEFSNLKAELLLLPSFNVIYKLTNNETAE